MQGIEVPTAYKHMLPRKYSRLEDYKPVIMRYLEKRQGEVIRGEEFIEALGTTTAVVHIKKLMKQGYITRVKAKSSRGHAYKYKWNTSPLDPRQAALSNGAVVTRSLDLPAYPIDYTSLTKLPELFIEWFDGTQPSAEQAAGALIFRKFIEDKYKEVDNTRNAKLKEAA